MDISIQQIRHHSRQFSGHSSVALFLCVLRHQTGMPARPGLSFPPAAALHKASNTLWTFWTFWTFWRQNAKRRIGPQQSRMDTRYCLGPHPETARLMPGKKNRQRAVFRLKTGLLPAAPGVWLLFCTAQGSGTVSRPNAWLALMVLSARRISIRVSIPSFCTPATA